MLKLTQQKQKAVNPTKMIHWKCPSCSDFESFCGVELSGNTHCEPAECVVCNELYAAGHTCRFCGREYKI